MKDQPRRTHGITLLPLLATLLLAPPTFAATAPLRYDFQARAATVEALLAAQQRIATAQGTSVTNDQARTLFKEAQSLHQTGDIETAYARLDEAYQLARISVRTLVEQPTAVTEPAAPVDPAPETGRRVATLSASVKALLDAYGRIAAETETSSGTAAQARIIYEHAQTLIAEGKEREALPRLKKSYALLQQNINALRGGRVLVRELRFDTPADEYWYEVDRLNTHLMLIKLLLDEPSLTADRRVQEAIDGAMKLNWAAQMDAAAGDYPKAIRQLEQATQGLFRVIMAKGFDIPG